MPHVFPEPRLLRIFTCVIRNNGFAASQRELNLSTSAISTYMSQLESLLGVVLCHRGRAGFSLTQKGETFHQEALRLLSEIDSFERFAGGLKGELAGELAIGVVDAMVDDPNFSLSEVLGAYAEKYPAVHVKMEVQSPYQLQLSVLANRLDIAISSVPLRMNGLNYDPLHQEQHWLYCSHLHPLFQAADVDHEALERQRMVGRSYWSQTELARHGFKRSEATVDSMEAQLILILSGAYIGFLPEHFAERWVRNARLRVLCQPDYGHVVPFYMATKRGRTKEPLIQKFRDMVKTAVKAKPR